jgi:ATP-binding cassette subfamily B protein
VSEAILTEIDYSKELSRGGFQGLWRVAGGYRLLYLFAITCMALSAAAKTTTFYLLRYFVDSVLGDAQQRSMIPLVALGFVGLAIVEGGFRFLSGRFSAKTAEGVVRGLRNYLFDHIQRLSFRYHDKTPTGELIQRSTSDVEAIRRFFAEQGIMLGRILFLFLINFGALLQLNSRLALLSVVFIPLIVGLSIYFYRRIYRSYEEYQNQEAKLSTVLQESLSGIRVVKAFGRKKFEKQKFERENAEKYQRGRAVMMLHALYWPLADLLCGFQWAAGLGMGAFMVARGVISLGTYLAFAGLIIYIIWPIRALGRLVVKMSSALVSLERVAKVLSEDREPLNEVGTPPDRPIRGEVTFRRVSFEYDRDVPVLHGIDFQCRPGQMIALLGPPGSGKTTLVNLLPRFYEHTSGELLIDGLPLKGLPRRYLRRHIGIVEQEPFLFSRTIRENITYGVDRDVPEEEVERAARFAAVHDVILSFPQAYGTVIGERGVTLSGGQKQRIAIARTLIKDPAILILDDSTSAVDMETEIAIRKALEKLMANRSTFVIAHRIQSLMKADLILVLDQGRIVQKGTHHELIGEEGFYRNIYKIQSRLEDGFSEERSDAVL